VFGCIGRLHRLFGGFTGEFDAVAPALHRLFLREFSGAGWPAQVAGMIDCGICRSWRAIAR
jgi:hypothetical protein